MAPQFNTFESFPPDRAIPAADLARIVHDLRNGIGGIAGLAEILRGTALPAVQDELVGSLVKGVENQLHLLDSLLQWTSAQSETRDSESFDLVDTLESCARLHHGSTHDKDVRIVVDIEPSLSSRVLGPSTAVQQSVCNLVSNAVRYTESGTVCIRAWRESLENVIVDILDTGVGVPESLQETMFQPFVHGNHQGSHGLGLAIVSEYIAAMNGVVECLRCEDGAHFRLTLPLEEISPAPTAMDASGQRVLLLTESKFLSESISRAFAYHEFQVSSAPCASGALAIIKSHKKRGSEFNLILVDANQGGLDDADIITLLRDEINSSTTIVSLQYLGESAAVQTRIDLPLCRRSVAHFASHHISGETDEVNRDNRDLTSGRTLQTHKIAPQQVLVVEDDAIQRTVMRRMLEQDGHTVEAVGSLADARTRLSLASFSVVICDYQLPDGDGLTLAREFHQGKHSSTPFFLSTGQPSAVLQARAKMAGVIGIMSKPNTIETLREALAALTHQPPSMA
ncbi:MAG: response regulator [Planctomycetes bacterium]|jgi:two-component system capsular synthesis sensor histidine kinase RcsC|nr:response regulator [Planctomycetota bacterium]MBT4029045.1 response regulator [Planctomycetota bacterium]MBT4560335.1 response regulator [Planctomycetota bacterium]MBT5102117.1 response regulator [Planctomycetota bacterium]MBT5120944.1 response regulator [Planctomycetota bacterium]